MKLYIGPPSYLVSFRKSDLYIQYLPPRIAEAPSSPKIQLFSDLPEVWIGEAKAFPREQPSKEPLTRPFFVPYGDVRCAHYRWEPP